MSAVCACAKPSARTSGKNALARNGGIRTDIAEYGLGNALPCPITKTLELAELKTRLKRLDAVVQERLINWGYAICDVAMRRWVVATAPAPTGFPYSASGIAD
jgi:NTE family protein